jgi:signal transduction histidine kinase
MTDRPDRALLVLLVHEVRSPAAALAAIASALGADDFRGESLRELLALASTACRGIERVVRDASPRSLRPERVDVADIARNAVAGAVLGGAKVRAELPSTPRLVDGDPVRLRQALDNLVANAIVHSGSEQADVVVTVADGCGTVLVSVHDTGVGLALEHHESIFEPGVRLDDTAPGSGLGLAVARAIADAHGGSLTVRSAPGEGASFTLALPRLGQARR